MRVRDFLVSCFGSGFVPILLILLRLIPVCLRFLHYFSASSSCSSVGRAGVERIFGDDRPYQTKVLARDRLAGILREVLLDSYPTAITVHYDTELIAVRWEDPTTTTTNTSNDGGSSRSSSSSSSSRESNRITPVITFQPTRPTGNSSNNQEPARRDHIKPPRREDIRCHLLVGADGTARKIASAMEAYTTNAQQQPHQQKRVRVVRYKDDNRRVYKTIPMTIPTNQNQHPNQTESTGVWRGDVNYSARTQDGRVVLDALPANTKGREDSFAGFSTCRVPRLTPATHYLYVFSLISFPFFFLVLNLLAGDHCYSDLGEYCAVLLLKAEDEYAQPNSSAVGLRSLLDATVPQFSPWITDATITAVANKAPSNIPRFTYVGGSLHLGGSTVLLGDAIHTVKPYFGLGVNSALEDVIALRDALDQYAPITSSRSSSSSNNSNNNDSNHTATATALAAYSSARAEEAEALVRISRGLDRPGILGVFTFIIPIILDGIFHSIAPQWFELNTIALLQRDGISFAEVGKIKRRDRCNQIAVLVLVLYSVNVFIAFVVKSVVPAGAVSLSLVGGVSVLIFGISQILRMFEGMAPADVLAKTLQPVTDVISAENRGKVIANKDDDEDDGDDENDNDDNSNSTNPIPFIGKGGLPLL